MNRKNVSIEEILASYNDKAALPEASTIPAPWYVDARIAELESPDRFQQDLANGGTAGAGGKAGPVRDRQRRRRTDRGGARQ